MPLLSAASIKINILSKSDHDIINSVISSMNNLEDRLLKPSKRNEKKIKKEIYI